MASGQHATVADCVGVLEASYPPAWAESWDAVGLAVGDPAAPVERVLFAVDPTVDVARQAAEYGADLLVTHHPLFLRGVHGVAESTAGGRVVATLVRAGAGLFTAHTNADVAAPGVSDALAEAVGLRGVEPLHGVEPLRDVPAADQDQRDTGPVPTDRPTELPTRNTGLGRVGNLPYQLTLAEFCAQVASSLPATSAGVRATGDPDRAVRRIAVCGGSGGELVGAAHAAGADAYLTADARHHHTLDAIARYDTALVDVAHWASEWPWLAWAEQRLRTGLAARGRTVNTVVSTIVTDPWRWHVACR